MQGGIGKKKEPKKLKLKDIPPQLRDKYKNHPIFQEERKQKQNIQRQQDPLVQEEIKKLKEKKEKSIEERLASTKIQQTEQIALNNVFDILVYGKTTKYVTEQDKKYKKINGKSVLQEYFGIDEIGQMLAKMQMTKLTRSEIQLMLWEIDENLDGKIDRQEFENMYKRCTQDENDLEPKSLFNMVQFLMYIYSENRIDNEEREIKDYSITQEDTLELLYVKKGREQMNEEIEQFFGEQDPSSQLQVEKRLSFPAYLECINNRAINDRKKRIDEKKKLQSTLKNSDDE